uniref:WWE domain-containing protein n=1 Tax=Zooxanthella nutricula TaxID=1333877 RepID=A0A7S2MPJ0_9DINO
MPLFCRSWLGVSVPDGAHGKRLPPSPASISTEGSASTTASSSSGPGLGSGSSRLSRCRALARAADDAVRKGRNNASDGTETTDSHTDDLTWVPGDTTEVPRKISAAIGAGRMVSRTISRVERLEEDDDSASDSEECCCHRVQCLFDYGWRDFAEAEAKQICDQLAEGHTEFSMQLRGHEYRFDFSRPGEASQTNKKSGKRRKLRILDRDSPAADEENSPGSSGPAPEAAAQRELGPQSKRGGACQAAIGKYLEGNKHAQSCFDFFEKQEAKLCGEWAVFYHSYSFAALIYEVHAAVASVLFRFRSQYASLPRILVHEFHEIPDAATLVQQFNDKFAENKRDHNPGFRKVGISAMTSLASTGPEACVARVFVQGYSCKDLSFRTVLENVLEACYVPKANVNRLASRVIKLSEKHGLDVSQFGGKPCKSQKAGHLMQIFIKRSLVDQLVYAAEPYGPVDDARMPVSRLVDSDESCLRGQVRIVANPKYFMQANAVRMFVASADPTFHKNRSMFQRELCDAIKELAEPSLRERAATGIYGGTLPSWWTAEDQRNHV